MFAILFVTSFDSFHSRDPRESLHCITDAWGLKVALFLRLSYPFDLCVRIPSEEKLSKFLLDHFRWRLVQVHLQVQVQVQLVRTVLQYCRRPNSNNTLCPGPLLPDHFTDAMTASAHQMGVVRAMVAEPGSIRVPPLLVLQPLHVKAPATAHVNAPQRTLNVNSLPIHSAKFNKTGRLHNCMSELSLLRPAWYRFKNITASLTAG